MRICPGGTIEDVGAAADTDGDADPIAQVAL